MASAVFTTKTERAAGTNRDALFISSATKKEINDDDFLQEQL
jgi:hypothetical protein